MGPVMSQVNIWRSLYLLSSAALATVTHFLETDWGNVVLSAEGWLLGMRGFNKHGALMTSLASVVGGVLFRGMVHE